MLQGKKKGLAILVSACVSLSGCGIFQNNESRPIKELAPLSEEAAETLFYKNISEINTIGDPFVLLAEDGKYYCYATSWSMGYLGWRSENLVDWERLGPVFRASSGNQWAANNFWAPEVVYYEGKYYMYYSALRMENQSMRIGVAVSDSPEGPFKDALGKPLFDYGYAVIDANVFIDDNGEKYLYYSKDCSENVVNGRHESHIYAVRLGDDMISVEGEPELLLQPEQPWEIASGDYRWNEGPYVLKHNNKYYMMYSANYYANKAYSVGYAVSETPLGPFVKYDQNPILQAMPTWTNVSGPGHNCVVPSLDGSELYTVYHTHTDVLAGGGERQIAVDRLGFREDGTMYINGPSTTLMPLPSGNSDYRNLAPMAEVMVSNGKETSNFLTDGQIGFYPKFSDYDWVSNDDNAAVTITLTWNQPIKATAIMLFDSAVKEAVKLNCFVRFDDGTGMENVIFPDEPGAGAIVGFEEKTIRSVKVTLSPVEVVTDKLRLSEIIVLGRE